MPEQTAHKVGLQGSLVGQLLLGYVIWRPVSNGQILYPVLTLLGLLSLADIVTGIRRTRYSRLLLTALVLYFAALGVSALNASINDNPGLSHQALTWGVGAVVWGLWAFAIRLESIKGILRAIAVASSFLSVVILMFAGSGVGILSFEPPEFLLEQQQAAIDTTTGVAIRFYGLSSLAITAPLLAAVTVVPQSRYLPSKWLTGVAAILAVGAAFVVGRRAIAIVTILAPLLIWAFSVALRGRGHRWFRVPPAVALFSPFAIGLGLFAFGGGALRQLGTAVRDGLATFTGLGWENNADMVRLIQAEQLLSAFESRPLFGWGMGAVLPSGYVRSFERPWSFELQYHLFLFNHGIVGLLLVLTAAILILKQAHAAASALPSGVPLLVVSAVGASSILIANVSNPYLQAIGHQWGVALFIGVLHAVTGATPSKSELRGEVLLSSQVGRT